MTFVGDWRSRHLRALLITAIVAVGCEAPQPANGVPAPEADAEYERGPHNGRLLRDGDFALEITIFETGVPPEFRVYPFRDDAPVDPRAVDLTIELGRLGDRIDRFDFSPQGEFLRGDGIVLEPHSFDVTVTAEADGREYRWQYASYEGRTRIDPDVAAAMGVAIETAGPATIRDTIAVHGFLKPDPAGVSEVRGGFPGLIESLAKSVGDEVRRGEELARIQSRESLQSYTVTAPVSGIIIERRAALGSLATDAPIYVIADTARLVADLSIFPRDLDRVAAGQTVRLTSLEGNTAAEAPIARLLPTLDPANRTATARVFVENPDGKWRPGQFVDGLITVAALDVPLAVKESGLQSFRDFTVVYARVDDTYEVRMLDLGRRDGEFVEVLGGLEPGTVYVTGNSYLIKADIEKSGASHDH